MPTVRPVCSRRAAWMAVVFGLAVSATASAQVARSFPALALRGVVVIGAMPEVSLNGRTARLAPGATVRGTDNLLIQPASVYGQEFVANYTLDAAGELDRVWLLRAEEAAVQPWPRTAEQQAAWQFDPIAQRWTRP